MSFRFPANFRFLPPEVLAARHQRVAAICRGQDLAGCLLTSAGDIYYLCGTMQQGVAWVDREGGARLLVRRDPERAAAESPLAVEAVDGFGQVAAALGPYLVGDARVGVCLDIMSAREYLGWRSRLEGAALIDVSRPWQEMKGVKDAWELERQAEAGKVAQEVYATVPGHLRPGVSELELAGLIQAEAMKRGHINLLRQRGSFLETYLWAVMSGPEGNTASTIDAAFSGYGPSLAFPAGASLKRIRPHEPINVDVGICLHGYISDQTRTYSLGPAPEAAHRGLECLMAVEDALLAAMLPGAVSGELYDLACAVAADHGGSQGFLGPPGRKTRYVAHGAGLELGVWPFIMEGSEASLLPGQVYSLELKMVTPAGPVGLEDTVVINSAGPPTNLTPIPRRLRELPSA